MKKTWYMVRLKSPEMRNENINQGTLILQAVETLKEVNLIMMRKNERVKKDSVLGDMVL